MNVDGSVKEGFKGHVRLLGPTSTYDSFDIALNFCLNVPETMKTVLFVFCMQNWKTIKGFRLNHQQYSSHYLEQETILMDGIDMAVLAIEEVKIDLSSSNQYQNFMMEGFDGTTFTVVYLFNSNS